MQRTPTPRDSGILRKYEDGENGASRMDDDPPPMYSPVPFGVTYAQYATTNISYTDQERRRNLFGMSSNQECQHRDPELRHVLGTTFCPVVTCDVFGKLRRGDHDGDREALRQIFTLFLQSITTNMPNTSVVDAWHRYLIHWLLYMQHILAVDLFWAKRGTSDGPVNTRPYRYKRDDVLHCYMRMIHEHPGGACTACHLGPSLACRSGIVRALRRALPVDEEWRGQHLPEMRNFNARQLRAWSTLTCIVTMGVIGEALRFDDVRRWSQAMLANSHAVQAELLHGDRWYSS